MIEYKLRKAIKSDIDFIIDLEKSSLHDYFVELHGKWETDLTKDTVKLEHYYIIQIDKKSAGYINYWQEEDFYTIDKFYILPKFQSQGIGKKLLKKVLNEVAAKNLKLVLLVLINNIKAQKFYLKNGMKEVYRNKEVVLIEFRK